MNKFIRKTVTSVLLSAILVASSSPVMASGLPSIIHERNESKHISSGVIHEHIERFTTSGWWNINVIRVDLTNPYTKIQGMIDSNGLSSRNTVSNMVRDTGAVAGINGDYFSYNPLPNSIGTLINKGEIISSPIEKAPYAAPSIFMNNNNHTIIGYMDRNIKILNKTQGKNISPYTINRIPDKFLNIGLVNRNWGAKSFGNRFNKDLVELVVVNGIVTDIRVDQPAVDIPKDGYILFARGDNGELLKSFQLNDELDLDVKVTPNLEEIKFAIGGGSIILKDGIPTLTNIHSGGNNARTGIGVNQDNTELLLVTIDNRGSYRGIGQKQFGSLMKDLGAHNSLNLDGGGSTTMAVKAVDDKEVKLANSPSAGSERRVVNGVGVYSDAPVEELDYIELEPDDNLMFNHTRRRLTVKGFDKHRNPIPLDGSKLNYTVEGIEGEFSGNQFISSTTGTANITVNYEDKSDSCQIRVIEGIDHIDTYMKEFTLEKGGTKELPNFNAYDGNGNRTRIFKEDVQLSVVNGIGHIDEKGVFHANDFDSSGVITAKVGNGVANIFVSVGDSNHLDKKNPIIPKESIQRDIKRVSNSKNAEGYSIGVTRDTRNLNEIVQYDATSSVKGELSKHDASIFLGGASKDFTNGINNELQFHSDSNYKKRIYKDISLINLNTSKRGIRSTDLTQWNKLRNDLNSIDTQNLILSTSTPIFGEGGFSDIKEAEYLHELLKELDNKGINVFVLQRHNQTNSQAKEGIRYINLNTSNITTPEGINSLPILEFTVNGSDISFQIRPLFPKK